MGARDRFSNRRGFSELVPRPIIFRPICVAANPRWRRRSRTALHAARGGRTAKSTIYFVPETLKCAANMTAGPVGKADDPISKPIHFDHFPVLIPATPRLDATPLLDSSEFLLFFGRHFFIPIEGPAIFRDLRNWRAAAIQPVGG